MNLLSIFKRNPSKETPAPAQSGARRFEAAKVNNLTAGWSTSIISMDAVLRMDLRNLRARSRVLAKNDPYMRRFLRLLRENVIGASGIRLQMNVTQSGNGGKMVKDEAANKAIETAWIEWGNRKNCTVDKRYSWQDVQELFITTLAKDGEILIRKIRGFKNNPFRYALQLIPADHLDEGFNRELPDGNYIRMGIEFNEWNEPIAYWLFTRHPGDYVYLSSRGFQDRIRVPADEIIHGFITDEIAQSRGFPWAACAMTRNNMLNGYEQAELVGARIGASHMGFFTSPEGDGYDGDGEGYDEDGDLVTITEAEPGQFEQLPAGVKFEQWNPTHPTTAFKDFVKGILRGVATGLGVSYNTLAGDYEGVNYSSLRQASLSERDTYRLLQKFVMDNLHAEIFGDWLLYAMSTGKIRLPLEKFEKFNSPIWRPRGWQWVDPTKEVAANGDAMSLKIQSATEIAAEQGRDIEQVYADLAAEKALRERYGLDEPVKGKPVTEGKPTDDETAKETE